MKSQILDTHTTLPPTSRPLLPSKPKTANAAVQLAMAGTVFLAISFTSWGMLRAEFTETFREFSACQAVTLDRVA